MTIGFMLMPDMDMVFERRISWMDSSTYIVMHR